MLLAASVCGTALAAEVFLRFARPVDYRNPQPRRPGDAWRELLHRPSAVPGLDYELAPNREQVSHGALIRTNGHGMRDDEPRPSDTPGLFRVAAVGDSFTFGWGVPVEHAYPEVLERLLSSDPLLRGRPAEVLNLAVSGYSTVHEVRVVEHKALAFEPDVILVGYFLNDPETDAVQPLSSYFARTAWWQRSHLLRLVAQAANRRAVARLGGGDYYRYVHSEPRKWSSVLDGFRDLARLARDDATGPTGIPVIVLIFPESRFADWQSYRYRDLHRQVSDAARAAGLQVIDLLGAFSAYPPKRMRIAPSDPHPSPLAHAIAAQAILDRLHADHEDLLGNP